MTVDIKIAAGQRLMAGLPGTELDPGFVSLVRECKVGNVILFRRNVKSAAQLERLCTSLRRLIVAETGFEPFIAIDQEGGVVSRFSPDMAITPGAMALAAAGGDAPYRAARITAQQLRAAGVNFDLAPVLDVNSNPLNPVIGVRSFGDVPEEAAERALGFMRGLLDGGIMACGKHFPGHGDTDTDSHIGLPKVDKSREELEKCELLPFRRAIEAGIPAIMTSHVLFPAIEPEKLPATMSRRILTGLLREEMGFNRYTYSDCMEMDAVAKYYGTVHRGDHGPGRRSRHRLHLPHRGPRARDRREALAELCLGRGRVRRRAREGRGADRRRQAPFYRPAKGGDAHIQAPRVRARAAGAELRTPQRSHTHAGQTPVFHRLRRDTRKPRLQRDNRHAVLCHNHGQALRRQLRRLLQRPPTLRRSPP